MSIHYVLVSFQFRFRPTRIRLGFELRDVVNGGRKVSCWRRSFAPATTLKNVREYQPIYRLRMVWGHFGDKVANSN